MRTTCIAVQSAKILQSVQYFGEVQGGGHSVRTLSVMYLKHIPSIFKDCFVIASHLTILTKKRSLSYLSTQCIL